MSLPPSRRNRAEWLQFLANDLTKQEWRELKIILNQRSFEFDIIGNLPIELVAHVCAYVPIEDSHICAYAVSKRWTEVFAQPIVRHALLSQWYWPSDPPLPGTDELDPDALFKVKAEHASRVILARPYYEFEEVVRNDTAEVFDGLNGQLRPYHYCSNALAYISTSSPPSLISGARSDTLTVYDLASKWMKVLRTAGREIILTVTVTEDLVGYITMSGVLFALDRKTQQTTSLNLPSAQVTAFCGRLGYLCVLIDSNIIVWNVSSRSVQDFAIPSTIKLPNREGHVLLWHDKYDVQLLLAPDADSVVLFVLAGRSLGRTSKHDTLYACRFRLNGELTSMSSLETRSSSAYGNNGGNVYYALGAVPCGYTGLRAVACASMETSDGDSLGEDIIMFNETDDTFLQHATDAFHVSEGQGVVFWKDICISGNFFESGVNGAWQELELSHARGSPRLALPSKKGSDWSNGDPRNWSKMHIFGDENVLLTVSFIQRYGQAMKIAGFIFHKELWNMQESTT